jgi:hypothetical protein
MQRKYRGASELFRHARAAAALTVAGGIVGLIVLRECSDMPNPEQAELLAVGLMLSTLGGITVLTGGRRDSTLP